MESELQVANACAVSPVYGREWTRSLPFAPVGRHRAKGRGSKLGRKGEAPGSCEVTKTSARVVSHRHEAALQHSRAVRQTPEFKDRY